jgi:hypothetical protein
VASDGSRDRIFRPGELAPVSGVYLVTHFATHRPPHEAVVLRGERLPLCRVCKSDVVFEIVQAISHVTHDWDFAGPTELMVKFKTGESVGLRLLPRYNIKLPLVAEVSHGKRPAVIHGYTHDLSEGGVSATMEAKLAKQGSIVALTIPLGSVEPIKLHARVRYRQGLRHGFKFMRESTAKRQAIRFALGE